MQVQFDHIAGRESLLWEVGEEEFVHHARTRDTNAAPRFRGWMSRHNHAAWYTERSYWDVRTVVEPALHLAFRVLLELIGREVQTRLNEWVIEHGVVFATGHEREASEIGEHGSSSILAVEPQQRVRKVELIGSEIPTNGGERLLQFLSISPIAPIPETAEPLITMRLRNRCACPNNLPTLASGVARSTDLIQSAMRRRSVFGLR